MNDTQRTQIYLTGFGLFGSHTENPTQKLASVFANDPRICFAETLRVSTEGATEGLLSMIKESKAHDPNVAKVFLHLGLNANSTAFHLETHAYNLADFSIPDASGRILKETTILPDAPQQYETSIPCSQICQAISSETGLPVKTSTDPGRYICNFVFFNSLHWSSQQQNSSTYGSLFVHVPDFSVIPEQQQVIFLDRLLDHLSSLKSFGGDKLSEFNSKWQASLEAKCKAEEELVAAEKARAEEALDAFYNTRTDCIAARQALNREHEDATKPSSQGTDNNPWEKVLSLVDSSADIQETNRMKTIFRDLKHQ